jgi:carbon-monoxide dehydrogenase small subunit
MNTKLTVNGQAHELEIEPHETLSQVLRNKLGLHGVRVSCTEGECGSCTVLLDGEPVTSCLMLALQAEGKEITTIEGLGTEENLHPIQEAFIEEQGYQCGFCTPGIILSTKAFLERNPNPSVSEVASALSGHICRCGAYVHIARSVMNAAKKM